MKPADHMARQARIERMEAIFDRSRAAVDELLEAAGRYEAVRSQLEELTRYYESSEWMEDLDADRAGEIPQEMKRGILAEDAIYDLLTDRRRMLRLLNALNEAENEKA